MVAVVEVVAAVDIDAIAGGLNSRDMVAVAAAVVDAYTVVVVAVVFHLGGLIAVHYSRCMIVVEVVVIVEIARVVGMTENMRTACKDLLVELLDSQDYMMVPVSFAWTVVVVMAVHSRNVDYYFFVVYAIVCLENVVLAVHIC